MTTRPLTRLDRRFSDPAADATSWDDTVRALEEAELYWLTTVRDDGRPHVTPLIGVLEDGAVHFCTGAGEQKARNLEHSNRVALTTGTNTWARGLDVVVEGLAVRVTDDEALRRLAGAYVAKYGEVWRFGVADGAFRNSESEDPVPVFRIEPSKVMAFAKDPHAQTTYRFTAGEPRPAAGRPDARALADRDPHRWRVRSPEGLKTGVTSVTPSARDPHARALHAPGHRQPR